MDEKKIGENFADTFSFPHGVHQGFILWLTAFHKITSGLNNIIYQVSLTTAIMIQVNFTFEIAIHVTNAMGRSQLDYYNSFCII